MDKLGTEQKSKISKFVLRYNVYKRNFLYNLSTINLGSKGVPRSVHPTHLNYYTISINDKNINRYRTCLSFVYC